MTHARLLGLNKPERAACLTRLHAEARAQRRSLLRFGARLFLGRRMSMGAQTEAAKDLYLPISRTQGKVFYAQVRAMGAKRIVEFGTSFGISTIYLAAGVQDNGGGVVYGTELAPNKVATARKNLEEAGVADCAQILEGDALETLKQIDAPIDMVLLDGWKDLYLPVMKLLSDRIRTGGVVFADNIFTFRKTLRPFVQWIETPANGYVSTTLRLGDGTQFAVKLDK